jgi:hypothetical protein
MATQTMSLEIVRNASEGIAKTLLHTVPPQMEGWLLKRGIERILLTTQYEYPPHFWETIDQYAANAGFVIAQNHFSNADILAVDLLANRITCRVNRTVPEEKKMGGFIEPFADSLPEDTQGEMSRFYKKVKPLINRLRVETGPTPTLNDILNNRIHSYKKYKDDLEESSKRMKEATSKERKGVILPAEATVQGGRIDPGTGDVYGMQVFTPNSVKLALYSVTEANDYGIIIPTAVSYGYKVLNSETNGITLPATVVGLTPIKQAIMTVHVGEPIIYKKSDIRGLNSDELNYLVATTIAQMLEPQERGVYSSQEKFDIALVEYMDKKRRADEIIKGLRAEYEAKKKEEAAIFPDQS